MSTPAPPQCYRHPGRETLVRCTRCDRPICPDCMREASVGFHCPDDVALARKTQRPARTSVGAVLRRSPPYVSGTLFVLNVAAYLATALPSTFGIDNPSGSRLFQDWLLQPNVVHADGSYYRLLTAAFLHLSLVHIATNMFTLVIIGPQLERLIGRWRFAAVYLIAALGGSAAIYAFGAPGGAVVGASGALFGLLGGCLVMARRLGLNLQWLVGIIVLNFVFTFSVPGISALGHVGGFLSGALCGLALVGWPTLQQRFSPRAQATGLGCVLLLVLVVVAVRTASF